MKNANAIRQVDQEISILMADNNFDPQAFFKMFNSRFREEYLKLGKFFKNGKEKSTEKPKLCKN